jgi:hypothetical protein
MGPSVARQGATVPLVILAKNAAGAPVAGATVTVSVLGANDAAPAVADLGDGSYIARYAARAAGADRVTATVDDARVTEDTDGRSDGTLAIEILSAEDAGPPPPIGTEYTPPVPALPSAPGAPREHGPSGGSSPVFFSGLTAECYRAFSWTSASPALTVTRTIGTGHETVVATPNPAAPWYVDVDPIDGADLTYQFKDRKTGALSRYAFVRASDIAACRAARTEPPAPVIEQDIDGDGNAEQYIDGVFQDTDGSTLPLAVADGGVLLDTTGTGASDLYWLPQSPSGAPLASPVIATGERLYIVKGSFSGARDFRPIETSSYALELATREPYVALVLTAAEAVPFPDRAADTPFAARIVVPILSFFGLAGSGTALLVLWGGFFLPRPAELKYLFLQVIQSLLVSLGLRKRRAPWGVVYDAVTKRPVAFARVHLLDGTQGRPAERAITDREGRYGFLPHAGSYRLDARKPGYRHAEDAERSDRDAVFEHLYIGGLLALSEGELVTRNIPLVPIGFDREIFEAGKTRRFRAYRQRRKWARYLGYASYMFGFASAAYEGYARPSLIAYAILALYGCLLVARVFWFPRHRAVAVTNPLGAPFSFAVVRVYGEDAAVPVQTVVADHLGRVYVLIAPGTYHVTIDEPRSDGSYRPVFSESLDLPRGVFEGDVIATGFLLENPAGAGTGASRMRPA